MSNEPGWSANPDITPGVLLGERFRIEAVLGTGGMATVYRALDESLGRTVALKVFRTDLAAADDVRRQRDEIQLLASLNAPGLVTLFDAIAEGVDGGHGRAYLVLEFVDGQDLRTRLLGGTLASATVATIGADVAEALAYIHSRGVVHRDVKPANILLPHEGVGQTGPCAKLTDFGIARIVDDAHLTATGTIIGTASYLSPEQSLGGPIAAESDVYSLGLVLLECLTGERAFPGTTLESVSARLARDPYIPPTLGADWLRVLTAMTERRPEDRFDAATAAAQLGILARAETAAPAATAPPAITALATTASVDEEPAEAEPLEATKIFPVDALTEPFLRNAPAAVGQDLSAGRSTTEQTVRLDTGLPPAPARRPHAMVWVIGGTIALTLLAILALSLAQFPGSSSPSMSTPPPSQAPAPAASSIFYPAVGGTLGDHLNQLQRSVAP